MELDIEMQYIYKWSTALIAICDKLDKVLSDWDISTKAVKDIKADAIYFDKLGSDTTTMLEATSIMLGNDIEAFQLIEEFKLYSAKLEEHIGKLPVDLTWKNAKFRLLHTRLLAQRGLHLSKLPTK